MIYRTFAMKALLLLVVDHLLLFVGLAKEVYFVLLVALSVLLVFVNWKNFSVLTATMVLAVLAGEAALNVIPLEARFYRPHEMLFDEYSEVERGYPANIEVEMTMPHGDLVAISPIAPRSLWQSRHVKVKTDSLGFVNYEDYHGQPFILVGDSFVEGIGNTQEDVLSEQLRRDYGIEAYNMAHPGEPNYYARLIAAADARFKTDPRLVLFLYEGNDFPGPPIINAEEEMSFARLARWYYGSYSSFFTAMVADTKLYQTWQGLYQRVSVLAQEYFTGEPRVIVRKVGPQDVGFREIYVEVTDRPSYDGHEMYDHDLKPVLPSVSLIVFVPTKYRVYRDLTSPPATQPAADAQWEYTVRLGQEFGIPVLNLTEPLKAESARLLENGEMTYWRDDSHWNAQGIAVAARELAKALKGLPARNATASVNQ